MQLNLTPAVKGLLTGTLMIGIALASFYGGLPADSPLQYLIYLAYALGITWTIRSFRHTEKFTGAFWDNFNQGFRCFIVVTLMMVAFTALFSKMHPEFAEETAKMYKDQLIKEAKSKTPVEIDAAVTSYKNGYTTMLVYSSIFGYLIIGAAVTAVLSAFTRRK